MRGRNPDNPSERKRSNGKYKQRIEMGSNISNTITSVQKDALVAEPKIATSYRIRKLTPRECFRLMGVTETDIDKIQQSGVSQSQQYKMAGNSIVCDVLYHILRKLLIEKENENQQLTLF
jgi:DNA (cytosine-5)-methyltransferase 1